ncbi:poly-gamma-glutamate synthesis protein (capsule biosynthesis protein) [Faunimonas pinastri]|uniref:Poly-gamma-glutamate synthesis protein (Capsule biosynthesis protein) n=1 Tax=Faunimonas pinastri TaxID=1855383 RepID=A0A1H9EBK2_9HYPH|nr:CapA family protein [Faunimonas pinastri]SEQ23015.1 poly-gamma-glutamate synthesis protein (capsule biosynthesis protein) [Faunimonas pinastri]
MRIIACGDALFSARNLARRLPRSLVETLAGADAVFANAEFCCPARTTSPAPRRFSTAVKPEVLDEFVDLNIRLVSFANNHTGDFGAQGVIDTIEAAEERGILSSGIGRSLDEARAAQFLDLPEGRVSLISAGTTRATEFAASPAGRGVPARPGLNPLRWSRSYVLPDAEFEQLRHIDDLLGTAASRQEVARIELMKHGGPDKFAFGSVFEGALQIERGTTAHVRYQMNETDARAILDNVRDAANRSEHVLLSLHAHEGLNDNWYSPEPAAFIEDFARRAVDAGATAVLGHGPHMLRGIEIYKGRPIFYSLGSLLMEFEGAETRMTPEMYEAFGFTRDSLPSQLHMSRVHDADGNRVGFYADPRFAQSCIAICDFEEGETRIKLVPIDLGLDRPRPSERGLPGLASPEFGREIGEAMSRMSAPYGTRITYDEVDGTLTVAVA